MATQASTTRGIVVAIGNGASPEVYTPIEEVTEWEGPDGEAEDIDATHFGSDATEWLNGLPDEGNVTLSVNYVPSAAGQIAVEAARANGELTNFRITLADTGATQIQFAGNVKRFSPGGPVRGKVSGSISIRVSGPRSIVP